MNNNHIPLKKVNDTFIDKIIYINLDHRIDRRASIERQLSVFSREKVLRYPAVYTPQSGFFGCAQSHINVLGYAIEKKLQNVLIVEDDMIWNDIEKHYCIFQYLATTKQYDVIVLGGNKELYDKETLRVSHVQAPVAYLVAGHYFEKLALNYLAGVNLLAQYNHPTTFALDQYCKTLQIFDKWYIVRPALCYQTDYLSDITNSYMNLGDTVLCKPDISGNEHSITSLAEFSTVESFNLFVHVAGSSPSSHFHINFDPFVFCLKYDISSLNQQELQSLVLNFKKCVIDLLYLDFPISVENITPIAALFKSTRYIVIPSSNSNECILEANWTEFLKLDAHSIYKNNLFK